eukprot:555889-Amorphochlora_amoeboformis.AAC.1
MPQPPNPTPSPNIPTQNDPARISTLVPISQSGSRNAEKLAASEPEDLGSVGSDGGGDEKRGKG